jgi:hypothetical protein
LSLGFPYKSTFQPKKLFTLIYQKKKNLNKMTKVSIKKGQKMELSTHLTTVGVETDQFHLFTHLHNVIEMPRNIPEGFLKT